MRTIRVLVAIGTVVAASTMGACSKTTPSATVATTAAPTSTKVADRADADGAQPSGAAADPTTGLSASDAERLRTIYLQNGIDPDTTECVVTTVVDALKDQVVTQAVLEAALADAGAKCGGASGSGLVKSIIDNYPTGGPVSSTTTVVGGGNSPIDNYPSGR